MNYIAPKYSRLGVSPARHKRLANEAKKLKISIERLVEKKLKASNK